MIFNITNIPELKYDFDNYEDLVFFYKVIDPQIYKLKNIYTEKHHIIPKCLGGNNDKENLINLPWMIHILAHFLIAKKFEILDTSISIKNYYAARMILNQNEIKKIENLEELKKISILQAIELDIKFKLKTCKRIYINKDKKTIQIFENDFENYQKQGWEKGRFFRSRPGDVWINNGEKSTHIAKEDLPKYLENGWKLGMYKTKNMKNYDRGKSLPKTRGYKWVNKDNKRLLVDPKDLENYLKQGWILGSGMKPMLGKKKRKSICE